MADRFATYFEIVKFEEKSKDDDDILDFSLVLSHPGLDGVFMFHEDVLWNFRDMNEYKSMPANRINGVFISAKILPQYSHNPETGREFDGWDWDEIVINIEDLGNYE